MLEYLIIILGMAGVTYLPRMMPLVFLANIELPPFWKRFMNYVPPAALTALIFPGILSATDSALFALAGGLTAMILAYQKFSLLAVVIFSILVVFILQLGVQL